MDIVLVNAVLGVKTALQMDTALEGIGQLNIAQWVQQTLARM